MNRNVLILEEAVHAALNAARAKLSDTDRALRLIVATSGGIDSRVLLHVLYQLKEQAQLELTVCHVNHGLRENSERDASFVSRLAEFYGLQFAGFTASPPWDGRENVESWARTIRYEFLHHLRLECEADYIVTAHQRNDLAETVLMRVLNGRVATGGVGLAELDTERRLLRPLLEVTRPLIEEYSQICRLEHIIDETNEDRRRLRNRIRHELLPNLAEQYNPNILESLATASERLNGDDAFLWATAKERFEAHQDEEWCVNDLTALPEAIRWRVVLLIAENQIGTDAWKLGYQMVREFVPRLCSAPKGIDLGFHIRVHLDTHGHLQFERESKNFSRHPQTPELLLIPGEVRREFMNLKLALSAKIVSRAELEEQKRAVTRHDYSLLAPDTAYFDERSFRGEPLTIRSFRNGDVVRVWKRGRRKLKKLFQERRVSLTVRDDVPIVELGGEILWVPGVARSDLAPVQPTSDSVIKLIWAVDEGEDKQTVLAS